MKDCSAIDSLPIEQLRAQFGDIMEEIVTEYGDNATPAQALQSDGDQTEESEAQG